MSKVTVHAGDFLKGDGQFSFGSLTLKTTAHPFMGETIPITELASVETASEESVKKIGGTKKEVTFVAILKDGRKFMATTDSSTYTKLQAAVF